MPNNPYASSDTPAHATDSRPLAGKALLFAVSSWVIVLLQCLAFFAAIVVAQTVTRQTGAYALGAVPILGIVSVVTTFTALVLVVRSWLRGERSMHLLIASLLVVGHGGLLLGGLALLIVAEFAQ